MNAVLSIQDAYDQDQGIFSVLIKKEVRGSGLLFLEKRRKVFGGAIGLKRPVNTKEDDVVTKASAHVREKDAIARYAAGLIRDDDAVFIDAGTTTERMIEPSVLWGRMVLILKKASQRRIWMKL